MEKKIKKGKKRPTQTKEKKAFESAGKPKSKPTFFGIGPNGGNGPISFVVDGPAATFSSGGRADMELRKNQSSF